VGPAPIALYRRGVETLAACWTAFARGSASAAVRRLPGVVAAVFPEAPERDVYNNAVLEHGLGARGRTDALDAMEAAYAAAGIPGFAAWVHETDGPMRRDLERRGYHLHETTRAMGMALDGVRVPRPAADLAPAPWREHLRLTGVPPTLLRGADHDAFHVLVGRLGGENVATALAFDRDGDRGIYNVGTLEHARRRGLGTALTAMLVHDALERGCRTASLQSTAMAERMYAGVGFRDLGRILEYAPGPACS
jgi:GNAT superfamily N-acetyltransferase